MSITEMEETEEGATMRINVTFSALCLSACSELIIRLPDSRSIESIVLFFVFFLKLKFE